MAYYKVKPGAQYVKRLKLDVLRRIEQWDAADLGTEDEEFCEDRLKKAIDELFEWCPEYKDCTAVRELESRIKADLEKEEA